MKKESEKKGKKKVKEEGKMRYYLKLMIENINHIVLAQAALLSSTVLPGSRSVEY